MFMIRTYSPITLGYVLSVLQTTPLLNDVVNHSVYDIKINIVDYNGHAAVEVYCKDVPVLILDLELALRMKDDTFSMHALLSDVGGDCPHVAKEYYSAYLSLHLISKLPNASERFCSQGVDLRDVNMQAIPVRKMSEEIPLWRLGKNENSVTTEYIYTRRGQSASICFGVDELEGNPLFENIFRKVDTNDIVDDVEVLHDIKTTDAMLLGRVMYAIHNSTADFTIPCGTYTANDFAAIPKMEGLACVDGLTVVIAPDHCDGQVLEFMINDVTVLTINRAGLNKLKEYDTSDAVHKRGNIIAKAFTSMLKLVQSVNSSGSIGMMLSTVSPPDRTTIAKMLNSCIFASTVSGYDAIMYQSNRSRYEAAMEMNRWIYEPVISNKYVYTSVEGEVVEFTSEDFEAVSILITPSPIPK